MFMRSFDSRTQSELTDYLVRRGLLKTPALIDAFRRVDRGWFLSPDNHWAYVDAPQGIGYHATISAPHMHAMMAELLVQRGPLQGKRILDIGSGTGYLTFVLGLLALPQQPPLPPSEASLSDSDAALFGSPTGAGPTVFGVEHVPELVASSNAILRKHLPELESIVQITQGDGRALSRNATVLSIRKRDLQRGFDLIHVGAGCEEFPDNLADLLRPGGRMVVPVGLHGHQELLVVDKDAHNQLSTKVDCGVMFVPLTDLKRQVSSWR